MRASSQPHVLRWFGTLVQDARYTVRTLRKYPFSNVTIVFTVALLVAAASVLYGSLRNDRIGYVPFPEPRRLVYFWRVSEERANLIFPADLYHEFRERLRSFEALGAIRGGADMALTGVGEPQHYDPLYVTSDALRVVGLGPIRGRLFDEQEYAAGSARVVLISEQLWRGKLEADPEIIGRDLRLADQAFTVIGVLPAVLRTTALGYNADLWLPTRVDRADLTMRLRLVGTLKPGVTRKQAQAELDTLAPRLEQQRTLEEWERRFAPNGFKTARVLPVHAAYNPGEGVPATVLLVWLYAGILLSCIVGIACFNVANLLLARHGARSREVALRLSLGASRFRIVQQLLTETVLLSLAGGMVGLFASFWLLHLLRYQNFDPKLDWRLYVIAFSGALVLGILVGLVPAVRSSRRDLTETIKEGGLAVGGRRRHRLRDVLVASEVAMASVLCVLGGLMAEQVLAIYQGDLGFRPDRMISVQVHPRSDRYPSAADQLAYVERGLEALRAIPGIEVATVVLAEVVTRAANREGLMLPDRAGGPHQRIQATMSRVSPGYTRLLGMPLLRGRGLPETSRPGAGEVLANEQFVARFLPDSDPLGQQILTGNGEQRLTIVGVVRDRHPRTTHDAVGPELFRDVRADYVQSGVIFVARANNPAGALVDRVHETIVRLDATQPAGVAVPVSKLLDQRVARVAKPAMLLGLLAAVGLAVALAGVYGVISFSVVERTREIGIRMAVGATPGSILRTVTWRGLRLILPGILFGLLGGALIGLTRMTSVATEGVTGQQGLICLGVLLLVALVGFSAVLFPARRAMKVNPMEALRTE